MVGILTRQQNEVEDAVSVENREQSRLEVSVSLIYEENHDGHDT